MRPGLVLFGLLLPALILAHSKEDHSKDPKMKMKPAPDRQQNVVQMSDIHSKINLEYLKYVKPILKTKCFDCHGEVEKYPWYIKLPGIKQLMEYDIREAKKHLDMSKDYPFGGHGEPKADLVSIRKAVEEGSMPPLQYRLVHWDSRLNKEEKGVLEEWINSAIKSLSKQ